MAGVGIDFGTTNSLLVAYDKLSNRFTYFNYDGEIPVPTSSTVWYHDNTIEVGGKARSNIHKFSNVEGHHFEKSIKLKLGTDYLTNIFGKGEKPSKVASDILKHILNEAKETWQAEKVVSLRQGIFSIPINFNGKARKDLRLAANESGIEITTFIHEPFAAIVGYYFTQEGKRFNDVIDDLHSLNGQYVLTFDWGGGTLDITVVKIEDGKMLEMGTSELTGLAGDKFDEIIAGWAWNKFLNKVSGKYNEEFLESVRKKIWGRLVSISENCKIELSEEKETMILLETVIPGEDEEIAEILTREEFAQQISMIIESACSKIDLAIRSAGISDETINHVLMVGGSCNIIPIQDRLKEKFGARVELVKNANLVIAQGAAVVSELDWKPFLTKDILLELSDSSYYQIFEKNLPIDTEKEAKNSEELTCVDQRNGFAKLIIADGDGLEQRKDTTLAIINVPILGDRRFGDDISLESTIDRDIVLNVSAYSKMVMDYNDREKSTIRKTAQIHKLCFGLDFGSLKGDV